MTEALFWMVILPVGIFLWTLVVWFVYCIFDYAFSFLKDKDDRRGD
jgi:hypothetical protein